MTTDTTRPAIADGISAIADRIDGCIVDLWGVVHDGVQPLPGAVDCMQRLVAAGKRICLLSNAPARVDALVARMDEMGVPRDAYHHLMSSGESTYQALRTRPDPAHAALGERCLMIGPEYNADILPDGDGIVRVFDLDDADFVVVTAWGGDGTPLEGYDDILRTCRARDIPLVCANPDLEVLQGGERYYCAGAIAARYQGIGGRVIYHGKPHERVYTHCQGLLGIDDAARVAGIGDSFLTDVTGANAAGMPSVLVAGGIHAIDLMRHEADVIDVIVLHDLVERHGASPDMVVPAFRW